MKQFLFSAVLIFISVIGFSQISQTRSDTTNIAHFSDTSKQSEINKDFLCGIHIPEDSLGTVFDFDEVMPVFPGDNMNQYLHKNIILQEQNSKCASGYVFVNFIIRKDGQLINAKIVKGMENCPETRKAVLEAMCGMPKWKPGTNNNHPCNTRITIKVVIN